MQQYGSAVLRLALGAVFVAHGAQKLFGLGGGAGPTGTAAWFAQLGLEPAYPLALLVGFLECAGGVLLLAGAFARYVALALASDMAVAIWKVHFQYGFFLNWNITPGVGHGYEFNLVLVAGLLAIVLSGPGALSVDAYRAGTAESEAYGRARIRAGRV